MKSRSFLLITLSMFLAMLLLFAMFTIIVDPLYQYHQPWMGLLPNAWNESYHNPGIAKTFSFDTVILGNSMSENFRSSWLDAAFGGKTVKLTMAGAYWSDYAVILDLLAQRKDQPARIIWNMPIKQAPLDKFRNPLPLYLYDNCLINDVNYLLNKDVFLDFTCKTLAQGKDTDAISFDEAYTWDSKYATGRKIALESYTRTAQPASKQKPDDTYLNLTAAYLERMRSYFEAMPNTQFYIWIPPSSMLYWDTQVRSGEAEALLAQQVFALEGLLKFKNVSLFMFTDGAFRSVLSDLDNYKDATHFSTEINRRILDCIASGEYQVTSQNLHQRMDDFSGFVLGFDYDSLFDAENP